MKKIHNIRSGSVKSIFCEYKVKNNVFPSGFIKSKTKDHRIKQHKLYLSNHKCQITNDMHNLPVI